MSYYLLIAGALLTAFILQFLFSMVQMITKEDCKGMEYSLRRSVLNAASNYNTIMDGGEVVETPGLLTRIADMLLGKSRKACK